MHKLHSKSVHDASPEPHLKLLIEVAVIDAAVPADANCVAAHHAFCSAGIKAVHQQLHGQLQMS